MKKIGLYAMWMSLGVVTSGVAGFGVAAAAYKGKETGTYFTVTFDTQVQGLEVASQSVEEGKLAVEPAVKRDGYQVSAWLYNDAPFSFATPITSDITLKAQWEEISVGGGNLDSIQYPTIAPAAYNEYASTDEIVEAYLEAIKENTEIFKQDILYSWSYANVYSKLQLLKIIQFDKYTTNVQISNIQVDAENKAIDFDAEINLEYKINDSVEKSWIEWMKWNYRSLKGTAKVHYSLNLTDMVRAEQDEYAESGLTVHNSTIDSGHIRYIDGICAIRYNENSKLIITSENATYVDIDGNEGEYTNAEEKEVNFIDLDNLDEIESTYFISYLLTKAFINIDSEESYAYVVTNESGDLPDDEELINGDGIGFKFASCYMAASNLSKEHLFEYLSAHRDAGGDINTCVYRISRVFDELHLYWLMLDQTTITFPEGINTEVDFVAYTIVENAFNPEYNRKIPYTSEDKLFDIEFPNNFYQSSRLFINNNAFKNSPIGSITIPNTLTADHIGDNAFYTYDSDNDTEYSSVWGDIIIDSQDVATGLNAKDACGYLAYNMDQEGVRILLLDSLTPSTWISTEFSQSGTKTIGSKTYNIYIKQ